MTESSASDGDARPALVATEVGLRFAEGGGVGPVSLSLAAGEVLAVLGPNGAGKSSLARRVAGLQRGDGSVELDGRPLDAMPAAERARRVAYVPQSEVAVEGLSVRALVCLGRAPHTGWLGVLRAEDERRVDEALRACSLEPIARRDISTLSGGEFRRALVARAVAQSAAVMVLDEPLASLDLRQQVAVCELLRSAARERRSAVVLVLHDPSLAARYADRCLLLRGGLCLAEGPVGEVLTPGRLAELYGLAMHRVPLPDGGFALVPGALGSVAE